MNLLLLDYISYFGHRNFNKIHIEALKEDGHELTLMGKKGQFENISLNEKVKVLEIPDRFFGNYPLPAITFRLQGIGTLLWVKTHVNLKEYDAIIILTYDILSLFVFRTSIPVLLINHNNVQQLWSKAKLTLTRSLPYNYKHIALNKDMGQRLHELVPGRRIFYIPHGLCLPSNEMERPSYISENERFVFCPVNRNYDVDFVKQVLESPMLSAYLRDNQIKLYIKEQLNVSRNEVIKVVPKSIESKQYNYMLQHAVAVLLPYGKEFRYRCSGIFFECVSRNTPVITTRLESMEEYESDVEMKMFLTEEELIEAIKNYQYYRPHTINLSKYEPRGYWRETLSALNLA